MGREDLCCFTIHGISLLIPTDSMAILSKPKLTHFCPPGSESLSCLNFRHSWAHLSLATMKRETYSLFANSPVRRHDHCLPPLALTILSQHLFSSGLMRCKGRKTARVLSGRWSKKCPEKCCTSHLSATCCWTGGNGTAVKCRRHLSFFSLASLQPQTHTNFKTVTFSIAMKRNNQSLCSKIRSQTC